MKRIICLLLSAAMAFSLAACGKNTEPAPSAESTAANAEKSSEAEAETTEEETAAAKSLYTAGTYTGTATGHGGPISVEVTLNETAIEGIAVTEHTESGGIGDVAFEHVITDVLENQSLDVEAVSGCTISRSAVLAAIKDALTTAGADVAALEKAPVERKAGEAITLEADVVVIGSGAAGMSAALEAAEAGASVIVLEKLPRNGGATRTSSAMLVVGGSRLQEEAQIEDSVQNLKDYWRERGEGNIDEETTDFVADHANEALEWLCDMGVDYAGGMILFSGTATVARAHMPALSGIEMMDHMVEKALDLGVALYMDTPAVSLVQDESGAVTGVKAEKDGAEATVHAKAVVIATGGYGWNEELLQQYSPNAAGAWPVTAPGKTGDGLLMAMEAGADTVFQGGYIGWKVVSPAYGHTTAIGGPIYGAANLVVNAEGSRFGNEALDYPFMYEDMVKDGSDTFYFIFDSGAGETVDLVENVSSTVANLELGVEAGVCFKGETIEELAEAAGLPFLAASVEQYNGAVDSGKDEAFGRDTATMSKVENGPFYALACQRAILGTFGGLHTNIAGEVLDGEGNAISGLYAAGEVANGAFFPVIYPASGSSLSMCVVLGREAGRSAAEFSGR